MTAATCGWVTMSMRELDRLKVIEAIIEGRLKPAAAAQRLRLTTRQVHRLVLRYREDGPAGLTTTSTTGSPAASAAKRATPPAAATSTCAGAPGPATCWSWSSRADAWRRRCRS
ncbi:helix-turn-helix domain-containing protein [Pseudomonas aeruginosa]|nr:helix-turn-helix domain-containing protein [Pseudomonas aeruginosa]